MKNKETRLVPAHLVTTDDGKNPMFLSQSVGNATTDVNGTEVKLEVLLLTNGALALYFPKGRDGLSDVETWLVTPQDMAESLLSKEDAAKQLAAATLALRNVMATALRMRRRSVHAESHETADHLLRFCAAGGVTPSVLREAGTNDETNGETHE